MRKLLPPPRPALDDEEKVAYADFRTNQIASFERLAAVAGSLSVLSFIWWDTQFSDGPVTDTLLIRVGIAALLMALFAATYTGLGRRHDITQLLSTTLLIAGFSWVLSRLPDGFTIGLGGLVLSVALLPMIATTLGSILRLCGLALAIPNVFLFGVGSDYLTVLNYNVWMLLAIFLAVSFWWVLDGTNRRLFLSERHVAAERARADRLLENILPAAIATRLKTSAATIADRFEAVTILFADIVGFTAFARSRQPAEVVDLLNALFSRFDDLVAESGLEKIKTLGDGYMVAGGVPTPRPDHAAAVATLALGMMEVTGSFARELDVDWGIRIGLHSGPVVAGVIGKRKFAYDLWGDTVNVASRLESTSEPGRIQLSQETAQLLANEFVVEPRGTVSLKNRGDVATYFLVDTVDSG
jgi:class 3 adenylate cyclase